VELKKTRKKEIEDYNDKLEQLERAKNTEATVYHLNDTTTLTNLGNQLPDDVKATDSSKVKNDARQATKQASYVSNQRQLVVDYYAPNQGPNPPGPSGRDFFSKTPERPSNAAFFGSGGGDGDLTRAVAAIVKLSGNISVLTESLEKAAAASDAARSAAAAVDKKLGVSKSQALTGRGQ
jgi:hypothetical protein